MVATLMAALHQNDIPLPLSKTDVYAKRFELLTDRWDNARGVATRNRILIKDKLIFLQRLALKLHISHRRVFEITDAEQIWCSGISRHYPRTSLEDFLWELRVCNSLIVMEGQNKWSLGHLSYQEYLAAQAIASGQRIKLLRDNFNNSRWHQVILFYAGITGDISPLLDYVQRDAPITSQRGFLNDLLAEARYTPETVQAFVCDVLNEDETEEEDEAEIDYTDDEEEAFDDYHDLEEEENDPTDSG